MRRRHIPWLIGLSAIACCGGVAGSDTEGATTTTASTVGTPIAPTTATVGTPIAPTTATVVALTVPGSELGEGILDAVEPGKYTSEATGVPITFTIAQPWVVYNLPSGALAWDVQSSGIDSGFIAFSVFEGRVFDDPCDVGLGEIEISARSLIDWLAGHPHLASSPVSEVTVGGRTGLQIDVVASAADECADDTPLVRLIGVPVVGDLHLQAGENARFVALEFGNVVLLLSVESAAEDWPAMLDFAKPFLDGLRIGS